MPISLALVGCAHIHTPGFIKMLSRRDDVKVARVWDHEPERARKRAAEVGAIVTEDLNAIWKDKSIAGVIVCSETDRHEDLVRAAARKKKHLFVEKPLGMATRDAYKMAGAVEKAGVIFQTGYFRRGDAVLRFLREQVQAGSFGKITRVRASNCHGGALGGWFDSKPADQVEADWRWMADPTRAGCGAFGDLGTHVLDILLWMFGEVEAVTALIDAGTARYPDSDETGEGLLRFKSGVIATLAAAWDDVANPVEFLISGTEGHAVVMRGQLYFQSKRLERMDGKDPIAAEKLPAPVPHAFELFLDAVAGKTPAVPLVTPAEAAYRNAVMEALYAGAKSRKWVAPRTPKALTSTVTAQR